MVLPPYKTPSRDPSETRARQGVLKAETPLCPEIFFEY